MYHWTDSKIRVHAFTCVLALTLSSLLQRTLHQKGRDLSLPRMFELLGGIRETLVIYPKTQGQHHPSVARALSTLSPEQKQLILLCDFIPAGGSRPAGGGDGVAGTVWSWHTRHKSVPPPSDAVSHSPSAPLQPHWALANAATP